MPLQSGSDTVLKAMRRAYRRDRYLAILDNVRAHIPHAAITTDIIVGFPGETEEDFAETLDVVRQARFSSAFTFQYSIRAGTPAATMADQVPRPVVQERYDRLVALVEQVATEENAKQDGTVVEVLVAEGEGRKDAATHRMSGRARDNRLVHFAPRGTSPRPGDIVTTRVTSTRAALPARRRRPAERPPYPGGRRLGGPPASPPRPRPRDRRGRGVRPRRSCSACRPAAASRSAYRHDIASSGGSRPPDRPADRDRRADRRRASPTSRSTWRWPSTARSSTPTRCSSTGAWTSARPS